MRIAFRMRNNLFGCLWLREAPIADARLRPFKEKLFSRATGKVVELGPGTGVNFKYLPRNITWVGIEPNQILLARLLANPHLPREATILKDISEIASESVTTVVSTLVLCSVEDLHRMLADITRILKKGGELLCVEHVAAPKGTLLRLLQWLIRLFTQFFGGGCEPDRNIALAIKRAGFSKVEISEHRLRISPLPVKVPVIACSATK